MIFDRSYNRKRATNSISCKTTILGSPIGPPNSRRAPPPVLPRLARPSGGPPLPQPPRPRSAPPRSLAGGSGAFTQWGVCPVGYNSTFCFVGCCIQLCGVVVLAVHVGMLLLAVSSATLCRVLPYACSGCCTGGALVLAARVERRAN